MARTALVSRPVQGNAPVRKCDSPFITLKMLACGIVNEAIAVTQAMPIEISSGL